MGKGYISGFTLVELAVTVSISLVISTLILSRFPEFSRRLELARAAQAIASSFREAESSALAVREFGAGLFPSFGLSFANIPAQSYVFFADLDLDRAYDGEGEKADEFMINGLPKISKICAGFKSNPPGDCSISRLDVVYVRPNPDIYISTDKGPYLDAAVVVSLPTGEEKKIIIWTTGQLSVE